METAEIVIFIVITLIIGILVLATLTTWNYQGLVDVLFDTQSDDPGFARVDSGEFVGKAIEFFQSCGLGAVDDTLSLYVEGTGSMTEVTFFGNVTKLNMCSSLQSSANNCGRMNNVDFNSGAAINLPHVVRLECNAATQMLVISD